jgi:hypothetical protein
MRAACAPAKVQEYGIIVADDRTPRLVVGRPREHPEVVHRPSDLNPFARFNAALARAIVSSTESAPALAQHYGIGLNTVTDIRHSRYRLFREKT